jgi:hypothetical protein
VVVAEEVVVRLLKAALGVEEAVGQEKQLAEEVAEEEDRLLQEVVVRVLTRWVAKEVVQAGQHFREEVEVAAFLQQQRLKLGMKNPLEVAEAGHQNEQAAVVGLMGGVCPRKEVVR